MATRGGSDRSTSGGSARSTRGRGYKCTSGGSDRIRSTSGWSSRSTSGGSGRSSNCNDGRINCSFTSIAARIEVIGTVVNHVQQRVMRIRAAKTTAFLPDFRTSVRLVRIGIVDAAQTNPFAPAKVAPILRRHGLELETLDEGMSLAAHVARGGGERNVDERGKRRRSGSGGGGGADAAAARAS